MLVDVFGLLRNKTMKSIRITPGLGNQMFQYALILNYKLKNEEIYFDLSACEHSNKHSNFELEKIFKINEFKLGVVKKIKIVGPYFYFKHREITFLKLINKIISKIFGEMYILNFRKYIIEKEANLEFNFNKKYLEINSDAYFAGHFNSPKYFEKIKGSILKVFTFNEIKERDENNLKILTKIKNTESVSIHVRRGDYVGTNLEVCDKNYYEEAFKFLENKLLNERRLIKENITIFIFSDDINWCKNNLDFLNDYEMIFVDWNKKENSFIDMQLMSECKYNIISNSSFSWWGAYLNQEINKIVLVPEFWFKGILNGEDRCESSWIRI